MKSSTYRIILAVSSILIFASPSSHAAPSEKGRCKHSVMFGTAVVNPYVNLWTQISSAASAVKTQADAIKFTTNLQNAIPQIVDADKKLAKSHASLNCMERFNDVNPDAQAALKLIDSLQTTISTFPQSQSNIMALYPASASVFKQLSNALSN